MSRYDRQDRNARQHPEGFWKRAPQQRWNTQEHYHLGHTDHYIHGKNDLNRGSGYLEAAAGALESYGAGSSLQAPRALADNTVMLDEMTLRHMVQDCTAVKTQLLRLKRLLHQNDENVSLQDITFSVPSSPEPQEPESTFKMDDLLNEIRQLKDELRKKDETINQLEQQLATRCNCQKDSQKPPGAARACADKFTQTSWRRSSGGYSAPSFSPWQGSFQGIPRSVPPHRRQRVEKLVHYFCDKACLKYYSLPAAFPIPQTSPREN
ncbi:serine-rich coiled-coil domain-containing protein 2 isoform X7 [Hirundo rustica]|nr:serine-rich coiled-coil domain-containing protein 2 isoform X7 [Hirundo rustica]